MKTRLNETHRNKLRKLARERVVTPKETENVDAAYLEALPLIRLEILQAFPLKDMQVLKRYDATTEDRCIKMQTEGGILRNFDIRESDPAALVPWRRGYCNSRIYVVQQHVIDAIDAWKDAVAAEKEAKEAKFRDYFTLINMSRNFEDVVDVWPTASELRDDICGSKGELVSDYQAMVERIKADAA